MTIGWQMVSAQTQEAESRAEPRSKLRFIFLGASAVSLIASFSLLAAAVYIQ